MAQLERYKNLIADLTSERSAWINSENLDQKITEELFDNKFTSTGLVLKDSKHWRYQALTFKWNRKYSKEVSELVEDQTLKNRVGFVLSQEQLNNRLLVEELVRPMINTGKNRSEYEDLVNDFVNAISKVKVDDSEIGPSFYEVRNGKVAPASWRIEDTIEHSTLPSSDEEFNRWFDEDFGEQTRGDAFDAFDTDAGADAATDSKSKGRANKDK